MNRALGSETDGLEIVEALSQTTFVRRRRNWYVSSLEKMSLACMMNHRTFHRIFGKVKRSVKSRMLLTCKQKFPKTCVNKRCRVDNREKLFQKIRTIRRFQGVSCQIRSRQFGTISRVLNLLLLSISTTSESFFI